MLLGKINIASSNCLQQLENAKPIFFLACGFHIVLANMKTVISAVS
jgi:hypothetical protein